MLTNSPGLAHPETPLRIGFGSSVDFLPHLPGGGAAEIVMLCQLSYILV